MNTVGMGKRELRHQLLNYSFYSMQVPLCTCSVFLEKVLFYFGGANLKCVKSERINVCFFPSHTSRVATGMAMLAHHFGPKGITSTTVGWIAMKCVTDGCFSLRINSF